MKAKERAETGRTESGLSSAKMPEMEAEGPKAKPPFAQAEEKLSKY